ncbi:unnamed protein product [Brachionus calyciflorus]|uniref:Uncharacterized protein n=1 Tax=Brachionus calyciflorus TaxID=104777 RepID=A0A814D027_9BILA|nr:unnamed protein product [Brachionus calyciflorus]
MEKITKSENNSRIRTILRSYDDFYDKIFGINSCEYFKNLEIFSKLYENFTKEEISLEKMVKMFQTIQNSMDTHNSFLTENLSHLKELILLELTRKSSDLSHRQQLQTLLINALNENELNKAFLINSFLNPCPSKQLPNTSDSNQIENFLDLINQVNNQNQKDNDVDMNLTPSISTEQVISTQDTNQNENNQSLEIKETSSEKPSEILDENINLNKKIKPKLRSGPLSPIRHLICSPGLEDKAHKYKIIILYRGVCNGYCYVNKPWSKQDHLHYIVDTVNCNDHISRLVKKQGIQFYNSFVLQSPDRWNQLIQSYKMEKIKQNGLN